MTWLVGYLKRRNIKKILRLNTILELDNLIPIKSETAPRINMYITLCFSPYIWSCFHSLKAYDLWLRVSKFNKLTIGTWKSDGEKKTISSIAIPSSNYDFIGFSSLIKADWEVQNGISYKYLYTIYVFDKYSLIALF